MRYARLVSSPSTDEGTFGTLRLDDGTVFTTGELPWRDNRSGVSCIPAGVYPCRWFDSPKHGWCYQIYNVANRDFIEIHSANFMGDAAKGKVAQLLGCIALGKSLGALETHADSGVLQRAVLRSKEAVAEFEQHMNGEDFTLTVVRL